MPFFSSLKPEIFQVVQNEINFRNVGFQILMRMGWVPGDGLGILKEGMKFPLQAKKIKNWKAGLGFQDGVTRILSPSTDVKFIPSTKATTQTLLLNDEKPVLCRTEKKKCTILIGDSNTKLIQFGSGKGSMGGSYPGRRIKAARIRNINPADCCGYANSVIVCGTNDLRLSEVDMADPDRYIKKLVTTLHEKLEQIRHLCPETNLIFMPVLPTRDCKMNDFVCAFNRTISRSEIWRKLSVTMPSLNNFLDDQNLLAHNLTRNGDFIHLGVRGLSMFVRVIKEAIVHA